MENIVDFMSAALPWIAMVLLLAVFFARAVHGKKEKEKKEDHSPKAWRWGCALALPCQRRYISMSAWV